MEALLSARAVACCYGGHPIDDGGILYHFQETAIAAMAMINRDFPRVYVSFVSFGIADNRLYLAVAEV